MTLDEIRKLWKKSSPEPWGGFNGTPEEWAWHCLEQHEPPAAFKYDNTEWEACIKLLLKSKPEFKKCEACGKLSGRAVYCSSACHWRSEQEDKK